MTLQDVRDVVLSFYTDKGLRREPIGTVRDRELSEQTVDFLRDWVRFLLTSDYISEEAKIYITHDYWTFDHVYNYPKFRGQKASTLRYHLTRAKTKLNRDFGSRMLTELLDYRAATDTYVNALEGLKEHFSAHNKFRRQYRIDIPDADTEDTAEPVDMHRVELLMKQLEPYRGEVVSAVLKNIDIAALEYVYRLLENQNTSGQLRRDRSELQKIIKQLRQDYAEQQNAAFSEIKQLTDAAAGTAEQAEQTDSQLNNPDSEEG